MRRSPRRCHWERSCLAEWLQITSGCHGEVRVNLMVALPLSLCTVCLLPVSLLFFHQFKVHSIPSQNGSVLTSDPCPVGHGSVYS